MNLKNIYIDLPIVLGGDMGMKDEDFVELVFNNLETGSTYMLSLEHNGVFLTIGGEIITPLIFTIPNPSGSFSISFLRYTLEEFIKESDLVKKIYKENNLDPYDESVPLSAFEKYDFKLSLACVKQGI